MFRGIENIQPSFAMWFPKGSDAKPSLDLFLETSDQSTSFITGTYAFTLPSREHVAYKWSALAHWVGNRIVKYDLFGDFTHCIMTQKAGKIIKDEL